MDIDVIDRSCEVAFVNLFTMADLQVFDDEAWRLLLFTGDDRSTIMLANALQSAPDHLVKQVVQNLPLEHYALFWHAYTDPLSYEAVHKAQQYILDKLFWELIYWRMPEAYVALTDGEALHPALFPHLELDIYGKRVVDIGAGAGRASFECYRYGVLHVYAVEPSPGLRRILAQKVERQALQKTISIHPGHFADLPFEDQSMDVAISCSAFTATPEQGGEQGLKEMLRVLRPGGKVIIIWPRQEDQSWLEEHGFTYVSFDATQEMGICFHSLDEAFRCIRLFYGRKPEVLRYLLTMQQPFLPFSVLGLHPPCEYCWIRKD